MHRERIERTRPYVVMDFFRWKFITNLRIRNLGAGVAQNIAVTFHPMPKTLDGTELGDHPAFSEPIAFLTPGTQLSVNFHSWRDLTGKRESERVTEESRKFVAEVEYQDVSGRKYKDRFPFDFERFRDTYVELESDSMEPWLSQVVDALSEIERNLRPSYGMRRPWFGE